MGSRIKARVIAPVIGAVVLAAGFAAPAQAFSSGSSITSGGVTYKANAQSCNAYVTSCSYSTTGNVSSTRSFTHRSDVKANGINVKVSISASGGATITGNSTTLATATKSVYGRSNATSGVAKPSIFSVSVAARSRLASGSSTVNSGWTTW